MGLISSTERAVTKFLTRPFAMIGAPKAPPTYAPQTQNGFGDGVDTFLAAHQAFNRSLLQSSFTTPADYSENGINAFGRAKRAVLNFLY